MKAPPARSLALPDLMADVSGRLLALAVRIYCGCFPLLLSCAHHRTARSETWRNMTSSPHEGGVPDKNTPTVVHKDFALRTASPLPPPAALMRVFHDHDDGSINVGIDPEPEFQSSPIHSISRKSLPLASDLSSTISSF
jgi:hypothetical protein